MLWTCRRLRIRLTRSILVVSVASQEMWWCELSGPGDPGRIPSVALLSRPSASDQLTALALKTHLAGGRLKPPFAYLRRRYRISTSRFGTGQQSGSNRTPLGLHRIGEKIGAGHPVGTVFESRCAVGFTWAGRPDAAIAHRILWLEGLEPGWNQGGEVDSRARFIYIHGLGNEPSLGRPASRGCIHMAATDLMPLFDRVAKGTLVWIQ